MVIVTAIVVILCYDVVIVTVILCIRQSLWVIVTVLVTGKGSSHCDSHFNTKYSHWGGHLNFGHFVCDLVIVTVILVILCCDVVSVTVITIYCPNVEEIDTIAIVQKLASNHPYLARNEAFK